MFKFGAKPRLCLVCRTHRAGSRCVAGQERCDPSLRSCYFIRWVFSLNCLAAAIDLAHGLKNKLSWGLVFLGLVNAACLGIIGIRSLAHWPSYELQAGRYNRSVMREIAKDLSHNLSNEDSFMWVVGLWKPGHAGVLRAGPVNGVPDCNRDGCDDRS